MIFASNFERIHNYKNLLVRHKSWTGGAMSPEHCVFVLCVYISGAPIIDPCYSIPCQHGGICTNLGDSYTCQCTARYNGSHCETDTGNLKYLL